MTANRTNCRADTFEVVEILSKAMARPATAESTEPFTEISPHQTERMGKVTAILQDVEWETHKGTYGPQTLLKRVKHETMACPDCEVAGVYDERGEVVCPEKCGRIISDTPLMLPEDHFNGRVEGTPSGSTPKPALNPAGNAGATSEPNVQ